MVFLGQLHLKPHLPFQLRAFLAPVVQPCRELANTEAMLLLPRRQEQHRQREQQQEQLLPAAA